jgi:hypothetical protein
MSGKSAVGTTDGRRQEDVVLFCQDMRRLTQAEMGALILSVLFILVGASTLLRPLERYVVHPSDTGGMAPSYGETGEYMSRNKARVYRATAIIAGALVGSLALYRGKEELK